MRQLLVLVLILHLSQAVSCVFTGLAVLLTIGRLWIRYRIIRSPYWDDIAHVLALLLLIAQVSIISSAGPLIYQLLKLETGKTQKQPNTGLYIRLDVAAILFAWSCLFAVKIAFLLFYRHLFQVSRRFIQSWWIVFIIVALTYCILITGSLTECGSPSDLGDVGMYFRLFAIFPKAQLTVCSKMRFSLHGSTTRNFHHL